MEGREQKVYQAKLAEQAERYKDMAACMKTVAEMDPHVLSGEERNLLSVAYKNVVGAKRSAWRILSGLEGQTDSNKALTEELRKQVAVELDEVCGEIEAILSDKLIPNANDGSDECKTFYHKMLADYYRYQAEFKIGDEKAAVIEKSRNSYQRAESCAASLQSTNPIRLGLALNYSVFMYEIREDPTEAKEVAKAAFDSALAHLDRLKEDSYKDSTLIMQLLRDNLTLWNAEQKDEDAGDE